VEGVDEAVDGDELIAGCFTAGPLGDKSLDGRGVAGLVKGGLMLLFPGLPGERVIAGIADQAFDSAFLALGEDTPGLFVIAVWATEYAFFVSALFFALGTGVIPMA